MERKGSLQISQARGSVAICGRHHVTSMSESAKRITFVAAVKEYFMISIARGMKFISPESVP